MDIDTSKPVRPVSWQPYRTSKGTPTNFLSAKHYYFEGSFETLCGLRWWGKHLQEKNRGDCKLCGAVIEKFGLARQDTES
jgi:hypothetical protein